MRDDRLKLLFKSFLKAPPATLSTFVPLKGCSFTLKDFGSKTAVIFQEPS